MSRALDPVVKNALKHGDHRQTFEKISTLFASRRDDYLELEILPMSHALEPDTVFLQDGLFVALPKLRLVQSFIYARRLLTAWLAHDEIISVACVRQATAALLLMDSEHLTAANTRKRLLVRSNVASDELLREDLEHESYFINSLLRSRLHRHTKSPVLWNQKRWLMRQSEMQIDISREFEDVIFIAAERHPRNYYAWTYARDLIAREMALPAGKSRLRETIIPLVRTWCRLHHQDISGWSILMDLTLLFPSSAHETLQEVTDLTEKYQWRNETVWHFLRNMARIPSVRAHESDVGRVMAVRDILRSEVDDDSFDATILDRAKSFMVVPAG